MTLEQELDTILTEHEKAEAEQDGPMEVLLDLSEVSRCNVETRHAFLRLQERLRDKSCRTAYVANRPRVRAIALWVIHQTDDQNARSLPLRAQADGWLGRRSQRLSEATSTSEEFADRLEGLRRRGR